MENNIEQIILTKEYEALNNAELAAISEHIANAEEYAQIRELLESLKTPDEEILTPDPAMKAALINKFQRSSALKVVKTSEANSKGNRVIFLRLSYAAMLAAAILIAFLLIKPSWKKENITANKTLPKQIKANNNNAKKEVAKTQEKQEMPIVKNNSNSIFAINKQANIIQKDSTSQSNIAALNTNQTQNQTVKKGRSLNEDLALMDVMYVAL